MRCSRIYCPQVLVAGTDIALESRNHHYLLHVLRVKPGVPLVLFDSEGSEFDASVSAVSRNQVSVSIGQPRAAAQSIESSLHTTLAIAVSKGERMDWVMQKATELGVSEIQPLLTSRVGVKLDERRAEKKLEHWRSIVIGACEQCGRRVLPRLHNPCALDLWLESLSGRASSEARITMQAGGGSFNEFVASYPNQPLQACLLVGPEGGLEQSEVNLAVAAGFVSVKMGERILRTETAPVVALSLLQHRWGDL